MLPWKRLASDLGLHRSIETPGNHRKLPNRPLRVVFLVSLKETPLPQMVGRVAELEAKVNRHLETRGFTV